MIPYFQFVSFQLGALTIYVWGLMVALGILVATWIGARLAKRQGLDPAVCWDLAGWGSLGGFVGARLAHVLLYAPQTYIHDPMRILALRDGGYSSLGAFVGGILAGVIYVRIKRIPLAPYANLGALCVPLGYGIGRIGCFLIHDHPGTATHFFLGVKYPDGMIRHDLGLYEALNGFGLAILMFILYKKKTPARLFVPVFLVWYGLVRFFLDFLRATNGVIVDSRYAGLTPAQYAAMGMFVWGLWLYATSTKASLSSRR